MIWEFWAFVFIDLQQLAPIYSSDLSFCSFCVHGRPQSISDDLRVLSFCFHWFAQSISSDLSFLSFCVHGPPQSISDDLKVLSFCFHWFAQSISSDLSFLSFCVHGRPQSISDDLSFLSFCFHWFAAAGPHLFLMIWAFWAFEPTQHTIILLERPEAQSSKWGHRTEQTPYRILVRQLAKVRTIVILYVAVRSKKQLRKSAMKA